MNEDQPQPPVGELDRAVCAVMSEIGAVRATGQNTSQNFRYASDVDLTLAVQPALASHGLTLIPERVDRTMSPHGQTRNGASQWRADVLVAYRLSHVSGESRTVMSAGCGVDTGDKAVYKALTGALKYAIRALFMVPTPKTDADWDPDASSPEPSRRGGWSQDRPSQGSGSRPSQGSQDRSQGQPQRRVELEVQRDDRGPFSHGCPSNLGACPACGGGVWDNRASGKRSDRSPDYRCKDKDRCKWRGWISGGSGSGSQGQGQGQEPPPFDADAPAASGFPRFQADLKTRGWDPDALVDWIPEQGWGDPRQWPDGHFRQFLNRLDTSKIVPPADCAMAPGDDDGIPF